LNILLFRQQIKKRPLPSQRLEDEDSLDEARVHAAKSQTLRAIKELTQPQSTLDETGI